MILGTIWAQGLNRGIAVGHKLPFRIPEDFRFFKETVSNCPVLMGRITWEATGRRPLPGCDTYVVTSQEDYPTPNATRCSTLGQAMEKLAATGAPLAWILGGSSIYEETLAKCDLCIITQVDLPTEDANVFAPELDEGWNLVASCPSDGWHTSSNGTRYRYEIYTRDGVVLPKGAWANTPDAPRL